MAKMKIAGSKIVDVGELLAELRSALDSRDTFSEDSLYDRGMRDELCWFYYRLSSLPEVPVVTSGQAAYDRMNR